MATHPDPANATTLDSSTTSATLELFRAALGPIHTHYYLKAFTRFDAKDRAGPSWNWAAGLLTLNWMALYRLWGAALAYVGAVLAAALLVLGIGRLAFGLSDEAQALGMLVLLVLCIAVPGVWGNAMLYNACRKRMDLALLASPTLADACAMLRRQAASRQRLIGLGLGNGVLLAGLAGIAVAYQGLQPAAPQTPPVAAAPLVAASAPVTTASAPASTASALAVTSAAQPAASEPVAQASSAPAAPASAKPADPAPPHTEAPTKAKAKKADVKDAKPWVVNVGLFADENNARNAASKLSDAGIPVLVNDMEFAKGKRTRVRAGPFATQAEAERAADKIHFIGLDAIISRN